MKIYFVSKVCKAKGPAFLKLAGNDYLEEGDICILDTEESIKAYLLTNEQRTWSHCKLIADVSLTIDTTWSNFLLYSYNGFDGRKGNVTALESLQFVFQTSVLSSLLEEAISILKFEKDHMDAFVIHKIYQKVLEKPTNQEKNKESQDSGTTSSKNYFVSFLKPDVIEKIRPMIVSGMSGKEIVAIIKNSCPLEFRQAFIEYNRYNPKGSIQEGLLEYLGKGEERTESFSEKNVIAHKNYTEILRNLNVNKQGDKISPHKPILLLSVMELVEKGGIVSPFIPISRELEETFKRLWEKYVPAGEGHQCSLQNPFFYMRSEGFWRLEPLPWYVEKTSYSLKDLRRNFYGAIIDKELFDVFCDKLRRDELRKVIINGFLILPSKMAQNNKIRKNLQEAQKVSSSVKADVVTCDEVKEPRAEYENKFGLRIVNYSDKTIAVYGDTKKLVAEFKNLGGYYCTSLLDGPCWIFSKDKRDEVNSTIFYNSVEKDKNEIKLIHNESYNQDKSSYTLRKSNNIGDYVNKSKSHEEWLTRLSNLSLGTYNGYPSPHKTIFILTIIEGIKKGIVRSEVIYPLVRLDELYKKIWSQYVPTVWPYKANFYQPFIHMCGEDFYTLDKIIGVKEFDLNQNWTKILVNKYISSGKLNKSLFQLLGDDDFTSKLIPQLTKIFSKDINGKIISTDTSSDYSISEENNFRQGVKQEMNFDLSRLGFKRFLINNPNPSGYSYSVKMADQYVAILESTYMFKIILKYQKRGDIYDIKDGSILDRILNEVRKDFGISTTNGTYQAAMELYIRFFSWWRNQHVQDVRPYNYTNNKTKSLPYGSKVKRIVSEAFIIEECGNSARMLYEFVDAVGVDKVYDLKIPFLRGYLVDKTRNLTYASNCKYFEGGFWLNAAGSLAKKLEHVQYIADRLNIKITIELIS